MLRPYEKKENKYEGVARARESAAIATLKSLIDEKMKIT